jgi:hypothetical protein
MMLETLHVHRSAASDMMLETHKVNMEVGCDSNMVPLNPNP